MNQNNGNSPLNCSGGSGLSNVNPPSFNTSSSSGGSGGGALALPQAGGAIAPAQGNPSGQRNISLQVRGILQLQGDLPPNFNLNEDIPIMAEIRFPPQEAMPPQIGYNQNGQNQAIVEFPPSPASSQRSGNYYTPPQSPCGNNVDLNASGQSGLSGLSQPSLNSSVQSGLQSNFNNYHIDGLRSGLGEVSPPRSLCSSAGSSPAGNLQLSPNRPTEDYYRKYNIPQNRNPAPPSGNAPERGVGIMAEGEVSFASTSSSGRSQQGVNTPSAGGSSYSVPSPGNNFTPPPPAASAQTPQPSPSTPCARTPQPTPSTTPCARTQPAPPTTPCAQAPQPTPSTTPCAQAPQPRPENYSTPQQLSPASVPSPGNNFTPPPLSPSSNRLANYVPPPPGTPCGNNLDLNVSGQSGLSGLSQPSLNSSVQSGLQSNFNNYQIDGLRSGLGEVSPPRSLCSSAAPSPTGNVSLGSGSDRLQLSPNRPTEDYYKQYNIPQNRSPAPQRGNASAAGVGIMAEGEVSFASTSSCGRSQQGANTPSSGGSSYSVPSPGNNFTPPPSSACARTPQPTPPTTPCAQAPLPRPENYNTPQQLSPASVPSPGNNFTPPGLPPHLQLPSRPEDNFRTPPRPDVLCGENLNVSNISGSGGGLNSMGRPNLNDTVSSIGTPSLNGSNRSGLSGVFMPSFNSTFSDSASDRGPVTSTPRAGGPNSPPDMIQFSPNPSPNLIQFSPNRSPPDMIQFSPNPSPNLMQFSPNNSNQSQGRNMGGDFGLGITKLPQQQPSPNACNRSPQGPSDNEISRIADIAFPTTPSPQSSPSSRYQGGNDSEVSRLAAFAFGSETPSPPRAFGTPPPANIATPGTPSSPETSALNRMVREAHNCRNEVMASTPGPRGSPTPMFDSPPSPVPVLRKCDIPAKTSIRLPEGPILSDAEYARQNDVAWNSFDEQILRENVPSTPGSPTGYGNWGMYNQSLQSNPNTSGFNMGLAGQLPFANTTLNSGGGQASLNSTMMSSVSQQPAPPSPFAYQSSQCSGNSSFNNDRSGGGGAGPSAMFIGSMNAYESTRDAGYGAVAAYPSSPLVNGGSRSRLGLGPSPVLPGAVSPCNRVFDNGLLRNWVMSLIGKTCQGNCGGSQSECYEHTLRYLMGVVAAWRSLYSRSDGRFNSLDSNHIFNK